MARHIKSRHTLPMLAVAVIVILAVSGVISPHTRIGSNQPAKNDVGTTVLGASTQAPMYQLKVEKLTILKLGNNTQKQRVIVRLNIKNTTLKTMQISPGLQTSLLDQNQTSYPYTAKYLAYGVDIGGPLAPSALRSQDFDFELPASVTPKQFVFQLDGSTPPSKVNL